MCLETLFFIREFYSRASKSFEIVIIECLVTIKFYLMMEVSFYVSLLKSREK